MLEDLGLYCVAGPSKYRLESVSSEDIGAAPSGQKTGPKRKLRLLQYDSEENESSGNARGKCRGKIGR